MPTPQQGVTKNAADPKGVRDASRLEKLREERFDNALASVMSTPAGRIVMGELLKRTGLFASGIARDVTVHHLAAQREFGLMLMGELQRVSEEHYQQMEREGWLWNKQFNDMVEATHTRRATEREDDR